MTQTKSNRFTKYFPLLLDALRSTDPLPMRPAEARDAVRAAIDVPEEDLSRRISGGSQSIFENDVHWARFYLAKAGLIESSKRGAWSLTPAGRGTHLTPEATWDLYVRVRDANRPGAAHEEFMPAPETDIEDEGPSDWFAGASFDGEDHAERFLANGVWRADSDDRLKRLVTRMRPRDRIAIKATFVQKYGLPFDVGGAAVSCMRIKATGTITGNKGDGTTVTVAWDPPSEPRDWYFYTYRTTLVEADSENEMALKLRQFTFDKVPQDYGWWLTQPYWAQKYPTAQVQPPPSPLAGGVVEPEAADAPEIAETRTKYGVDEIVADGSFLKKDELERILLCWKTKRNLILQGPPGTGKTFLAKRLGYALIGSKDRETTRSRLRVVHFHPSLAYEDFVRGWRPKGKEGLELVDGIFMQAMEAAASEPDREFVLVIEEINRGNPAQIFGELLTLIEVGMRRREEAIELAYRRTDGERVFVPDNLFIIGTMNIADRSLALVDLALRRRFAFVDLEPQLGPEWRAWCTARGLSGDVVEQIAERIQALNEKIADAPSLGPQFRIGHSYVTPEQGTFVPDGRAWFRAKVDTEIGPLLREYWYDSAETARAAFAKLVDGF